MATQELWQVRYDYEEVGCPPEDSMGVGGNIYLIAESQSEAIEKARKFPEINNINNVKLEARKYSPPELSLDEDRVKFGLEISIINHLNL